MPAWVGWSWRAGGAGSVRLRLGLGLGDGFRDGLGLGRRGGHDGHHRQGARPGGPAHRLARLPAADGGRLGVRESGRVAHELAQRVADAARGGQVEVAAGVRPRPRGVGVEHRVAERVEHPRDAGPDLPRPQHPAVRVRRGLDDGRRGAGPAGGQGGVQEPGQPGDVVRHPSGRQPVEGRVDGEADHPHRPGAVDEDVLGDQAPVGDPGRVRDLERARHLADQPGGPARGQRTVVGQQDVERDARRPLVDDEAERGAVARGLVGGLVDVEDPQQAAVHHARGRPGRLAQQARPLVVGADDVHRDRPVQRGVVRPVEEAATALVEQVDQLVAAGQDVAGADRVRHGPPPRPRIGCAHRRWVTACWSAVATAG